MNRNEYIASLRTQLKALPSSDVEDIVKEFETHFEIGISEGKSESDIAAKLGSPSEVAQIYLSDTVPAFDMQGAGATASAVTPDYPMVPVKTGLGLGCGVGPQTIAGFCNSQEAIPAKNIPPKKELGGAFPHRGAKEKEEYTQTTHKKKDYKLPEYSEYPSHDPNHVFPQKIGNPRVFAVVFTIFVGIPALALAILLLLALIAWPVATGFAAFMLFTAVTKVTAISVCLALALVFATISALIVLFFAVKWFFKGIFAYFKWLGKLWSKEA